MFKSFLKYLINKINDLADKMVQDAQVDPDVSYDEYLEIKREKDKLHRV